LWARHFPHVSLYPAPVSVLSWVGFHSDSNREAAEHAKRLESLTQQVELATAEMQELSVQNSRIEDEFQAATDNLNRAKAESTRASRAATEYVGL